MKSIYKIIGLLSILIFLYGFICPYLISNISDELVIFGMILAIVPFPAITISLYKEINKLKNQG